MSSISINNINKKEIIEWAIFILILLLVWTHVNVVVSDSMVPVMERGDFVVVTNANIEFNVNSIKKGDIVVYEAHWPTNNYRIIKRNINIDGYSNLAILDGDTTKLVIHRVIDKVQYNGKTYLIFKGDNNPVHDPELVSLSQVKQRVLVINNNPVIIPYLGYISIILKENIIFVILLILLWYAYDTIIKRDDNKKDDNKNNNKNNNNKSRK